MDKLQGETLVTLAELLIKELKDGHHHSLELFPKLLSVISSKKTIQYRKGKQQLTVIIMLMPPALPAENGMRGTMEGPVQKGHLLNSLCGCRWDTTCVQHIAHMCQEIPMDSDELEFLINKILRCVAQNI